MLSVPFFLYHFGFSVPESRETSFISAGFLQELTTPDENLAYIWKLLGPPAGEVESAEEEGLVRDHEPTPVAQCTLEEYASTSGAHLPLESPPRKRSRFTENSGTPRARDVVNCFLHPDVVRLVAEKLKELRAPPAE
ncbi:unnamed protein product [Ixodes persulcatus]